MRNLDKIIEKKYDNDYFYLVDVELFRFVDLNTVKELKEVLK